ncbi:MAG: HDIG domain-containing protein [Thermodesulfovibrionales bacterium]|nr:HDIG domain-containing protein [Thermodesulfovibrionales bacterium]
MKNGTQKISRKIDIKKYLLLIVFGFLAAIAIQERAGAERFAGGLLTACLLLAILYRDIRRYKPAYFKNYSMLVLLGFMIVSTLVLGRFFEYILVNLAHGIGLAPMDNITWWFGIPIASGAMLATLLFDFHTAIVFSFVVSLLSGLWLNSAIFPVYAFIGSLTAAFSVIRCKRRSALLRGGFYVGVMNSITASILLLFTGEFFSAKAFPAVMFALSSGISVTAVVSVMLPILEYTFKVTTDISLLELLDMEQPLMKNLMITAPGTYHHSVIVGNLVESAAEAVGVNPLLARVSSYYHDIGKIKMPEYFIENQSSSLSKHEKLAPHMSSMIISSHVKEGVELANQHKLPQPIIDIIEQHHGTSLMTFFYQKAKGQREENEPAEEEYKYPGPKPQTRVAALVMMADAVEAASKVLNGPTPARIAALVDKIINHIFLEGQLDECELTLKDISEIKKHFSYILTGILHKRIDYPSFNFNGSASKSQEAQRQINEGSNTEQAKNGKDKSAKDKT